MNYEELIKKHNVSRETFDKLSNHHDLLIKWQKTINLIGKNDIGNIWERHIIDSLNLLPLINDKEKIITDIGSGGGFPGIILACCGYEVNLVESDKRKSIFLKESSRKNELNAKIINQRVESIENHKADIITSRACASIKDLLTLCQNIISKKTICFFHKGENCSKELEEALSQFSFSHQSHITQDNNVIVEISDISK